MARRLQFGVAMRNARLDAIEATASGTTLEIRAGTMPVNCAASDGSNTLLCQIALGTNFMNAASGGVKTINGTWTADGLATGTASYFRFKHFGFAGLFTIHMQGNIVEEGSEDEGAMELDDLNVMLGEPVTVTMFSLTDGNA